MKISKEQMNMIAKSGNYQLIEKVLAAESSRDLELALSKEESLLLNRTDVIKTEMPSLIKVKTYESVQDEPPMDLMPDIRDLQYHLYNMCYDKPIEETMDELTKYAKSKGISPKALRYVVDNIDKDYTLKYESQYNSSARELLSEEDLSVVLTEPEAAIYYQAEEREREEREKEQEEELEYSF